MFVGIDMGGSGTRAALASADGSVLASGLGGSSGAQVGAAGRRLIERALSSALAPIASRVADSDQWYVHVGLRGLSVPGRREAVSVYLGSRLPNARVQISNDAVIALWGGLGGREGVAVLAGTGSICLARSNDGREARTGGYGYLVSDEGSGFWVGREALAACLRALDGRGPPTILFDLAGDTAGLRTPQDIVAWLYAGAAQVERVAALAPLVARAAQQQDAIALDIMRRAAEALAELAVTAARQVWPNGVPDRLPVACCGGVWAAGDVLRQPFTACVEASIATAEVSDPKLAPVGGSLLLAMGADRVPLSAAVEERLSQRLGAASPPAPRS
jgi:N-acetylglucosamine kinase-like BadF-type ATPase